MCFFSVELPTRYLGLVLIYQTPKTPMSVEELNKLPLYDLIFVDQAIGILAHFCAYYTVKIDNSDKYQIAVLQLMKFEKDLQIKIKARYPEYNPGPIFNRL